MKKIFKIKSKRIIVYKMTSIIIKYNYNPLDKLSKVCLFEPDEYLNTYKNYYENYLEFLIIEKNILGRDDKIMKAIDELPYNYNLELLIKILLKIVDFCDLDMFKYFINKFPIEINNNLADEILSILFCNKNYTFILHIYNHLGCKFYDYYTYHLEYKIKYFKSKLNDKDINFIKFQFEEEKVINYNYNSIVELIDLFCLNSSIELNKFLFEKIVLYDKTEYLLECSLKKCIYNNNIKYFNYIIKSKEFKEYFIDNTTFEWKDIFCEFYKRLDTGVNNQRIQSKLIYTLLCKFKEYGVLDNFIEKINKLIYFSYDNDDEFDKSLLITIIKLPNVIPTLELFINKIKFNDDIFVDKDNSNLFLKSLFRYGYPNTIKYILDNTNLVSEIKIDNKEYFIINNLFCSRHLTFIKQFLKDYNNNKYPYLKSIKSINKFIYGSLSWDFINIEKNYENTKKKINLLEKNFDIQPVMYEFIYKIFNNERDIENIDLYKFVLKKYVSVYNIDKDIFVRYIEHIFYTISKTKNIELIELFLNVTKNIICKHKYCYWNLVLEALENNDWYSQQINILLEYCPDLKDIDIKTKEKIVLNICKTQDYNNELYSYQDYINILKIFINIGVKLNDIKYYGRSLLHITTYNSQMFKALVYLGVDFKTFFYNNINRRMFQSQVSPWLKLYVLIKRIEIIINYKNKKLHNKKYRDSVIDLLNRPPTKSKKVLQKGGLLYYKNIDEFNSLCLENGDDDISDLENSNLINKYINPITITREELLKLDNSIFISQKVDGINVKNIPKDLLFPQLDSKFDNVILDGEYIKELDVYLIFNTRCNTNMFNTHFDDSLELINSHPFTKKLLTLDDMMLGNHLSESKMKLLFYSEFNLLLNFCEKNNNIKNKWFPKIFYKIIDPKNNLTILSLMEEYHYGIYKKMLGSRNLLTIDSEEYIKKARIKTDGIIIYDLDNRNKIMKYKPKEFMTIDIDYYNNKKIYRCYYNYETKKFEPLELRTDKKYPNPRNVVKQIKEYHKNPFTVKDLIKEEEQLTFIRYYQKNGIKDKDTSEFMMEYKYVIGSIINRREVYYSDYILDLGCGYFNNQLWKSDKKMVGVDIDKKIHNYYKINKSKFINKEFRLFDFREGWRISFNEKFDMCYMNMTIHYAFETKTTIRRFFKQLYKILKDDGKVFITFIDSQQLFTNDSIIDLSDNSYIKDLGDKLEINYSFRHSEPIIEPKLDYELIIKIFDNYGFELFKDYSNVSNRELKNNNWNIILKNTKYLFFQKKNVNLI